MDQLWGLLEQGLEVAKSTSASLPGQSARPAAPAAPPNAALVADYVK